MGGRRIFAAISRIFITGGMLEMINKLLNIIGTEYYCNVGDERER